LDLKNINPFISAAGLRSQSRKESEVFGWNQISKNTRNRRSQIFYPTPKVQMNIFLHRTPKLGILTRACWNGTISFETFIETEVLLCTTISI